MTAASMSTNSARMWAWYSRSPTPSRNPSSRTWPTACGSTAYATSGFIREKVEESLIGAALWDEVKDKLKKSAYELSGGQQQRLCIAPRAGRLAPPSC